VQAKTTAFAINQEWGQILLLQERWPSQSSGLRSKS